jgi:Neuraminidase-like domain/Salmonella virulence plasmid 28.1kDa A protein
MNLITAPINEKSPVPTIQNLQDGLLRLLQWLQSEPARESLLEEQQAGRYGGVTKELVFGFQRRSELEGTGYVDRPTADAMNRLLRELGEFDQPQAETFWVVSGRIQHDNEIPFKGGIVRAFHQAEQDAIRLGEDRTDPEGRYTIRYTRLPGINTINLRVNVSDNDLNILQSSDVIPAAKPIEIINLMVSSVQTIEFQVEGKVSSPTSTSVGDLTVQVVDKAVGGEDVLLKQTVTQADGTYQVTFNDSNWRQRGKTQPDIQTRVLVGDRVLAVSEVRYNASPRELLNVLLTETVAPALQSEHQTLLQNLSSHFQGNLRDLQETDIRQDITYLANKTGWDARAVAIASLADQFSDRSQIAPAFFYTLFRAGVPANEEALYQIDAKTAESAWKQGIKQGVIPAALEAQLPQVVERFRALSAQRALDAPALAGVSSLKEMLTSAQIGDLQQQQFVNLYAQHRDNLTHFWDAVQRDMGEPVAQRLRMDGQLGYLTLNNAPLMQSLHQDIGGANGITTPLSLIENGYYQAEKWQTLMANGVTIPPEIPGKDVAEKRSNYAELMSAQMRLSYPTAVVAQMVRTGETPLKNAIGEQVHALLMEHHGNFEIGLQPIEQFALQNNVQIAPEVMQEVTRIQRVHQITPSDRAMNTLLRNNLDSAYKIVQYDQADFVQQFKDELGGETNAILTHAKAQQVHNTVLNIATSYLTGRNAPAIGSNLNGRIINSLSGPSVNPAANLAAANAADIIAYPTLENLFGEMDYCTCDHCRSILSPAAYLVNLLQFCDRPADGDRNPQIVLLSRRPDIQHLPLTCENTNTPLPYIDVVLETLEYFIVSEPAKPSQPAKPPLSLTQYQGYSTSSDATPEELLASPQFVREKDLVSDRAYQTLAGKPRQVGDPLPLLPPSPPLPFHQPLENLRRYFDQFEVLLPNVMAALRKNDGLERASETEYGWRDILMEELRISRAEYRLLSDRTLTLQHLYGYPTTIAENDILGRKVFEIGVNFITELDQGQISPELSQLFADNGNPLSDRRQAEVRKLGDHWEIVDNFTFDLRKEGATISVYIIGIANAKKLARRVGVSYEEIIEIIKTRFVNPNAVLIPKLERLGVPFATLKAFKDGAITDAEFDKLIPTELDATQYGGDIKAWVRNDANYAKIMGLITLTNPTAVADPCRFDQLEFRYANPDNNTNRVRPFEFVRLIRFIRLWKKLGWTIAQTDQAIAALYPADQIPNDLDDAFNLEKLDAGFLILLPRLGVIKQVMTTLNLKLKKDLLPLLACFASIDIYGMSLYRQMFLSAALLKQDAVFADDGFGNFLTNPTQTLVAHAEALRAALHLTEDELRQIMTALGYNDNTPLSLETLSAIFRRGWLARILKLSVREFLLLTQFTGLYPFATPDPFHPPIQRFIELVQQLRTVSLKPVQALYLIWNQDISGKSVPNDSEILGFTRSLRAALTAIEGEYTVTDDPDGQIARSRMALVYGNAATDLFFGLLNNTLVSAVAYSHGQAALETAITNAAPSQIAYDDFRKQMTFTGVLTTAIRDALKAIPGVSQEFKDKIGELYDKNQKVIQPFFARYPELLPLYEIYIVANDPVEQKRANLLANFLPELKRRRKQQQALQSISAATKVEAEIANALLTNATVLHTVNAPSQPAFNDLIAEETPGLSAQFFFRDTATGDVDIARDAESNLAYSTAERHPLPANAATPNSAISGIWRGYLEAPENGFYNISVEADTGATVTLMVEGKAIEPIALTLTGNLWRNDQPIDLRAGSLYAIALTVEKVKDVLKVRWQTSGRGWEVIPSVYLYSDTLTSHLRATYIRFLKAATLAIALKLTASEIAYFTAHKDYQIGGQGWLNSLPVNGSPDITTALALRNAFTALLDFAHLKTELSPDDERLLTLLKDPDAAARPEPEKGPESSLLFRLTRWEERSRNALLNHFGVAIANLTRLSTFRRVFDAYAPIRALGISASALVNAATNEPNANTVRDLQSALRARYDESDWLKVLKPINDEMRGLQRDALVAYILHQMRANPTTAHIDTPDKLFEYFLMDVQMEPCMQTSRIRHALSSVQLFIERCLMNLETGVSPSAINAKQWSWMKRYRVWEANRKVFLYPENWLEPELRDDQSPFFKEAMSELLQGDITEDRAAVALLNYLSKLEEVAKLEPCGIHYVENDPTKLEDDIAHVVVRTPGANRKYFYRRREYGYWTPWEQIKLDIEDNPVIPVVWKDRLFLFWLRIIKQAPLDATKMAASPGPTDDKNQEKTLANVKPSEVKDSAKKDATANTKITVQAVLCWSEYYNGKWQPTKTSDINYPTEIGSFTVAGSDAFNRKKISLTIVEWAEGLTIVINGYSESWFVLYNTHSLPIRKEDWPSMSLGNVRLPLPSRRLSNNANVVISEYIQPDFHSLQRNIFKFPNGVDYHFTVPNHRMQETWTAPFFYEDSRHVFYVSTSDRPVTISEFKGLGFNEYLPKRELYIPPLVLESPPKIRDRLGPVAMDSRIAVVDSAPMKRFVTEDAYIKKGIATTGTVRFGDKDISATGIMRNQQIQ